MRDSRVRMLHEDDHDYPVVQHLIGYCEIDLRRMRRGETYHPRNEVQFGQVREPSSVSPPAEEDEHRQ